MHELRWTLLILGVVFIVVLAWWERRKPRQASGDRPDTHGHTDQRNLSWDFGEPGAPARPARESGNAPRVYREPTLTLPEVRTREPSAPHDLPVVEITDDLRVEAGEPGLPVLEPVFPTSERAAAEEEPIGPETEADADADADAPEAHAAHADAPEEADAGDPDRAPVAEADTDALDQTEPDDASTDPADAAAEPIVEWPPDAQRKIIAVRLVSPAADRFPGRAVRQALAAEGFVLGKYSIFHKAGEDRRAYLSAASLTQPGTFDPQTMDMQRYGGLSLFAVLPGPKAPPQTFDELLATARNLNERLQGALQDEKGGPLTPTRIAAVRDSLTAEASS